MKAPAYVLTLISFLCLMLIACDKGEQITTHYEDGTVKETVTVQHGAEGEQLRHGPAVKWHPNGQKKAEGGYHEGVKHGSWIYWDEQGNQAKEENYRHGVRRIGF